jgi:hypothetical protein
MAELLSIHIEIFQYYKYIHKYTCQNIAKLHHIHQYSYSNCHQYINIYMKCFNITNIHKYTCQNIAELYHIYQSSHQNIAELSSIFKYSNVLAELNSYQNIAELYHIHQYSYQNIAELSSIF